jgi:flagellar biosynthetic protein FlhB
MADEERTEQATPRKRQEARQKGQVARSTEINGAAIFLALVLTLPLAMRWGGERFLAAFQQQILQAGVGRLSDAIGLSALMVLAPLMAAAFLTALVANAMQVGIYFTAQPLQPDLNRINPVKGFQRLFSQRSAVELLKAVLKFGLITWVAWRTLQAETERLVAASQLPMPYALAPMTDALYQVGLRVGALWLVLAILDYLYQRWDFEKTIRMSRYELKEEFKQTEGDPYLRARIRQRMQEAARQRSIRDVRRADVVVTNPVTYAVALRYDRATMTAPRVVAKAGAGSRSASAKRRYAGMCRLCRTRRWRAASTRRWRSARRSPAHSTKRSPRCWRMCTACGAAGGRRRRNPSNP